MAARRRPEGPEFMASVRSYQAGNGVRRGDAGIHLFCNPQMLSTDVPRVGHSGEWEEMTQSLSS